MKSKRRGKGGGGACGSLSSSHTNQIRGNAGVQIYQLGVCSLLRKRARLLREVCQRAPHCDGRHRSTTLQMLVGVCPFMGYEAANAFHMFKTQTLVDMFRRSPIDAPTTEWLL